MLVDTGLSLAGLVAQQPAASRVLLRHGLDFCCGGQRSLKEACEKKGLSVEQVASELALTVESPDDVRWDKASLPSLVTHILDVYHAPLPEDLAQLTAMADKVLRVHGAKDLQRLTRLAGSIHAISEELLPHLQKEERVLFPWIVEGRQPRPSAPITVMLREHDSAGELLELIRELTSGFTPPPEACNTWRNLYARLADFDGALRRHIHLENFVLFPRALGE